MRWIAMAALLLGVGSADAGEILVPEPQKLDPQPVQATVVLEAPNVTLTSPGGRGIGKWTISFGATAFQAPLTVSIRQPPANYEAFDLTFDIPYSWEQGKPHKIASALVNDARDDNATRLFLATYKPTPPNDDDALVLMNHRARRIWSARLQELNLGDGPIRYDFDVAYRLLASSQRLVLKQGLQLDSVTRSAMNWLDNELSDTSQAWLYGGDPAQKSNAVDLLKQLGQRDSLVFNSLVTQMQSDIAVSDRALAKSACERVEALNIHFSLLTVPDRDQVNSKYVVTLVTKTTLADCTARGFARDRAAGKMPSAADKAAAQALLQDLKTNINDPAFAPYSEALREAKARADGLEQQLR